MFSLFHACVSDILINSICLLCFKKHLFIYPFVQAQQRLQQYKGRKNINLQASLEDIESKSDLFYTILLFNLHILSSFQKVENKLRKVSFLGKTPITRSLSEALFLLQPLLKINLKF